MAVTPMHPLLAPVIKTFPKSIECSTNVQLSLLNWFPDTSLSSSPLAHQICSLKAPINYSSLSSSTGKASCRILALFAYTNGIFELGSEGRVPPLPDDIDHRRPSDEQEHVRLRHKLLSLLPRPAPKSRPQPRCCTAILPFRMLRATSAVRAPLSG